MFEHFKLFLFLILLISGFGVIAYLKQIYKSFPDKVIKAIIVCCLWFILLEIIRFLITYIETNLSLNELSSFVSCLWFFLYFGLLFSIYLLLNILLCFRGVSFKKSHNKWVILIALFIILSFTIKTYIPESYKLLGWVDYIQPTLISLIRISSYIELLILIGFHFSWKFFTPSVERMKISKAFTFIFIVANGLPIIFFHIHAYFFSHETYGWFIMYIVNFVFFLIIYLWTKYIFLDFAQKASTLIDKRNKFKSIYNKYKISKRETEIIELLIEGKSSNEIKEVLFLSYHTVKNHISHIYVKLNVKTRPELIHFFLKKGA